MKVVINECYGGFGLSTAARERYLELSGQRPTNWFDIKRNNKYLVQVVEELGIEANGSCAFLKIVDIEPGRWYRIEEYNGYDTTRYRDLDIEWQLAIDD